MRNQLNLLKRSINFEGIKQFLDTEVEDYKFDALLDLYSIINASQAIIYCNTIRK